MTTWKSPDNKTTRQIDYIMISHRYRNSVREANVVPGWRANMAQQQHGVIKMEICLKLMKNYKKINLKKPDPRLNTISKNYEKAQRK